jgi:hypothetical protein
MSYTIVSIVPLAIDEYKNTLKPYQYKLDASVDAEEPQVLVIDDVVETFYFPEMGKAGEHRDIPKNPEEVAAAVVRDYVNASLLADNDAHPGLFWVKGSFDAEDIKKKFKAELVKARETQRKWFWALVKDADDTWNKWHQHKTIAPVQVLAAKLLNIRRAWTVDPLTEEMKECPSCLEYVRAAAKVCTHCKSSLMETADA